MAIYNKEIYLLSTTGLQNGVHDGYWLHEVNPLITGLSLNTPDPDKKDFKDGDELHIHFAVKPQSTANFVRPAKAGPFDISYFHLDISGKTTNLLVQIPFDTTQNFLDALADGKIVDVTTTLNEYTPGLFNGPASATTFTISDNPRKVKIDGKGVKSISIGGNKLKDLTVNTHTYSFVNYLIITKSRVQSFVKSYTTWLGDIASIDTSVKLDGLVVEYSKSSGLANGDTIDVTVKYDSAINDTLNGGTTDITYGGINILNPLITLTDDEIKKGIQGAITWNGKVGQLDVSKWPYAGTTLYAGSPQVHDGLPVAWRIGAATGFTINGAHIYNFNYAPIAAVANSDDYYYGAVKSAYKSTTHRPLYNLPNVIIGVLVGPTGNIYYNVYNDVYKNTTKLFSAPYGSHTYKMCVDKDNNIYYATSDGVYKNTTKLYTTSGRVYAMSISEDGSLMVNADYNVYKDGVLQYTMNALSANGRAFDKNGNFFIHQEGKVYDHEGKPANLHVKVNKYNYGSMVIDGDNNVYIGTDIVLDLDLNYYYKDHSSNNWYKNSTLLSGFNLEYSNYLAPATEYGGRTGNW